MHESPPDVEIRTRLGDLSKEWDDLVERQDLPSAFLRSWWIDNAAGGDTQFVVCRDRGRLVGGAAFEIDRLGRGPASLERVRCVGQGELAPDHLDLIAAPDHIESVARAVWNHLHRRGSRLIDLDGLASEGTLASIYRRSVVSRVVAPYATLPATYSDYLAGRPGRARSTIKRSGKRLAADGIVLRRVDRADGERALDTLSTLHDSRWAEDSQFLSSWPAFRAAALAGIERGDVIVHELVRSTAASPAEGSTEEVVATELDLLLGGRLSFYQAGRRTDRELRGSGSVLKSGIVEWAISSGVHEYDLLRGDEPYKAEWADDRRHVTRIRVGVGPVGRLVSTGAAAWYVAAPKVLRVERDA